MKPIPARNRELEPAQAIVTSFALVNACVFVGFVADRNDPTRRFTIDLLLDGLVVKTAYADQFDPAGPGGLRWRRLLRICGSGSSVRSSITLKSPRHGRQTSEFALERH